MPLLMLATVYHTAPAPPAVAAPARLTANVLPVSKPYMCPPPQRHLLLVPPAPVLRYTSTQPTRRLVFSSTLSTRPAFLSLISACLSSPHLPRPLCCSRPDCARCVCAGSRYCSACSRKIRPRCLLRWHREPQPQTPRAPPSPALCAFR